MAWHGQTRVREAWMDGGRAAGNAAAAAWTWHLDERAGQGTVDEYSTKKKDTSIPMAERVLLC